MTTTQLTTTRQLLEAAPQKLTVDAQLIADAIDAAVACSLACRACASACLSEPEVEGMATCVRDDLDCATMCDAVADSLIRLNRSDKTLTTSLLATCIEACVQCAASCAPHAGHHEHCKLCEQACSACEAACQALLDALGAPDGR